MSVVGETPLKVAVLLGSTREGRVCPSVGGWVAERARERPGLEVSVLDLAEFDFPGRYPEEATEAMRAFARRVAEAEAFVVVSPEYNRSLPASLKQAIDFAYDEWRAKPAGLVTYGCGSVGMYVMEHLRVVFTELHMVTMRDGIALDLLGDGVDGSGRPRGTDAQVRAGEAMLDQLTWWGLALRAARDRRPYVS
ncbi:NADPH-dependent FMN reductase [Bailinhaonella thermotolerans]|uniref:NADPH-dependent oxidoreductase n=1 Tax=Bailinhaonella thermotolerans TaxID=1070861 RepID=A0A3A4AXW1_9ACTN|nr:NAD(P)H-dependent oxidoreductase [Bailinhaonella thermotolerans]RJL24242.1 NADPH-dependent oxidoreductase [Bailinhaonella thermotolerans]